jgi:hypothetical protein
MVAVWLIVWMVMGAVGLPAANLPATNLPSAAGGGCTVLYATDGEQMLGGNNEDYYNPLTKVWFIPGEDGSYGRVYFGFDDFHPQGGMNERGLFFDGLALDTTLPVPTEGKEPYAGNLADRAMAECATVECVVGIFGRYYAVDAWHWQYLFGDATGESAIVEAQEILRQRGGTQVATNFLQSSTPPERRTCWRYRTAAPRLGQREALIASRRDSDVDAAALQANGLEPGALQAYAGAYELPEGWGAPDEALHVIAGDRPLWLHLPDHRRHELLPGAADTFFHVAFRDSQFAVAYEVAFACDGEGRVATLEASSGSSAMARC